MATAAVGRETLLTLEPCLVKMLNRAFVFPTCLIDFAIG